jgi:hypothetical protein
MRGNIITGMLVFILGGLLFAIGVIGFVAAATSSPIIQQWDKLGSLPLHYLWQATLLVVIFFILFLAGVYLMKVALSKQN